MSTQTETEDNNDNTEAVVSVEMKMMNNSSSAAEGAAICCMAPNEDYEVRSRNLVTKATICHNPMALKQTVFSLQEASGSNSLVT